MIRFAARTVLTLFANAAGLLIASLVLPGLKMRRFPSVAAACERLESSTNSSCIAIQPKNTYLVIIATLAAVNLSLCLLILDLL
jgi:hypothetical protein